MALDGVFHTPLQGAIPPSLQVRNGALVRSGRIYSKRELTGSDHDALRVGLRVDLRAK